MREIDLAIIGHVSRNREITPLGERVIFDGGAYCAAVGASSVSKAVGLVTRVGPDFNLKALTERHIDIEGTKVIPEGKTPFFTTQQNRDGTRTFIYSEMGLASDVDTSIFPESYDLTKYIYLATSPPQHHLEWINYLKSRSLVSGKMPDIAVNAFEKFVSDYPDETKNALLNSGLIFLNEEELTMLRNYGGISFTVPLILTKGGQGAVYIDGSITITVPAPCVKVVDTTGAGDILAGVFLALCAKNVPVEQALEKAVSVASQSVTDFGVEHINPLPKEHIIYEQNRASE